MIFKTDIEAKLFQPLAAEIFSDQTELSLKLRYCGSALIFEVAVENPQKFKRTKMHSHLTLEDAIEDFNYVSTNYLSLLMTHGDELDKILK